MASFDADLLESSFQSSGFLNSDAPVLDSGFHSESLSIEESGIHARATRAAESFKRSEAELMEALIAVGESKLHLKMGYPSLFRYATDALKLSESVAYGAISVARKAVLVPPLREAVASGELGLSKAKKVLSVLKPSDSPSDQAAWVEKAVQFSSRKLERVVAAENPAALIPERVVYRSARRIELSLGVDEDLLLDFRQAQNLVSSGRAGAADLEATLGEVVRFYLERKDPERRARRVTAKKGVRTEEVAREKGPRSETGSHSESGSSLDSDSRSGEPSGSHESRVETKLSKSERFTGTAPGEKYSPHPVREPIPAGLAHRVRLRDRNPCQAPMPNGKVCGSKRWLEVHHRIPVSRGGANHIENLATWCRAHHQAHHRFEHSKQAAKA